MFYDRIMNLVSILNNSLTVKVKSLEIQPEIMSTTNIALTISSCVSFTQLYVI